MAFVPGTYVEDGNAGPPELTFVSPSAVLLAGEAADGPSGVPTHVTSIETYTQLFGGSPPSTLLDHGVRQFFDNGGTAAAIIRIAATVHSAEFYAGLVAAIQSHLASEALNGVGLISVPGLDHIATLQLLQELAKDSGKFLLVDCEAACSLQSVRQQASLLRGGNGINSALFFPWLSYAGVNLPAGPAIAGIIARSDRERGCWRSPGGLGYPIGNAAGLVQPVGNAEQDILNPENICCLRSDIAGGAVVLWGGRTLAMTGDLEWKYMSVRRFGLALEKSLYSGLAWAVFEPNAPPLWAKLRLIVGNLLLNLFQQGALQGATVSQAYYVRCGLGQTMTEPDVAAGRVVVEIGFAPSKPSEFIVLRLGLAAQPC